MCIRDSAQSPGLYLVGSDMYLFVHFITSVTSAEESYVCLLYTSYDEQAAQAAESLDIERCMMMKAARQAFKLSLIHIYWERRLAFRIC